MLDKVLSSVRSMSLAIPVLLIAGALAAVLVGCFGDFAPVSPNKESAGIGEPEWITFEVPESVRASKTILRSAARIDPETGGIVPGIQISSNVSISFSVPPQSSGSELDEPEVINLSVNETGILIIDFGPDGTRFDPPAELIVHGARLNRNPVSLYWQNPRTGEWARQNTNVSVGADGTITASIFHFSRYGLAD